MRPPQLAGVVERRLLVNYRTDPEAVARLLPAPLRPQLVKGSAVAGICLLRLARLRPQHVPGTFGLRSENAAHRIAVEWDTPGGVTTGVYIPRRDTDSTLSAIVGGRLFPGQHHRAWFDVQESADGFRVAFTSTDRTVSARVGARTTTRWTSELFATIEQASDFFRRDSAGYSATNDERRLDGLELRTDDWRVEPVEILTAHSSVFADPKRFPPGSASLDCALLMRDVPVRWNPLPPMAVHRVASMSIS